jgi:hypothetical protein
MRSSRSTCRAPLAGVLLLFACASRQEPAEVTITLPSPSPLDASLAPTKAHNLASFEEAWAQALPDEIKEGVPLSDSQLALPLQDGAFLTRCGAPSSTHITIKVAVFDGLPIGVTVTTSPVDPALRDCIDAAVRVMQWPQSMQRDAITTTY